MAVVNGDNRYFTYYLVIINPGIEKRIKQRNQEKEDQNALIGERLFHLLNPDITHVVYTLIDLI